MTTSFGTALLILAFALPTLACGGEPTAADNAGPAHSSEPAPASSPSSTSGPAPGAQPATLTPVADGDSIPFEVESSEARVRPPGSTGALLSATSSQGEVIVHLDRFSYYCSPDPTFTATRVGNTLRLSLTQPDAVTRCISVYTMDLSFGGIDQGAWLERVVIVGPDGAEQLAGDVVRSR